MSQHGPEPQNSRTKPAPSLRSQTTSVETAHLSVASGVSSRGTRSTLSRATSAPLPVEYLEEIQIPAEHSEQLPGTELAPNYCALLSGCILVPHVMHVVHTQSYIGSQETGIMAGVLKPHVAVLPGRPTSASKDWVFKASLVDKWAFLAKTALIVHRLRGTDTTASRMHMLRGCANCASDTCFLALSGLASFPDFSCIAANHFCIHRATIQQLHHPCFSSPIQYGTSRSFAC